MAISVTLPLEIENSKLGNHTNRGTMKQRQKSTFAPLHMPTPRLELK